MPHRFEASKLIPMVVVDAEPLDRILQLIVDHNILAEEDEARSNDFEIIGKQLRTEREPLVVIDDFPEIIMDIQT